MDNTVSLFGDMAELKPVRPVMPELIGDENKEELLAREKELVGMYLSSHPLDRYEFELRNFTTCEVVELASLVDECTNKQS